MKNFTLLLSALVLALILSACGASGELESTALDPTEQAEEKEAGLKKADLTLLEVTKGRKNRFSTISGRVIPSNTTQLFAEVQGRIVAGGIPFKVGMSFKKGDVLLRIDQGEFELNLEAERSAFFNSLTGIMPDMKSDYPENYDNWLSYIENYAFGEALPVLPATKSNNEKYFITTYQIYTQYYRIKSQEERLSKYTIVAPYAGTIVQSNVDVGGFVSPAQPLGTLISSYSFELEAGVDLATAQLLKGGDRLTFVSNEVEGNWLGKVVRTSNVIDPSTQNIPVFFQLSGKGIRSGMYLEGNFPLASYEEVTLLPTNALSRDGSVLLLEAAVIRNKKVETIEYLTDSVIVKGLETGDLVILNNFKLPVVGQKVAL